MKKKVLVLAVCAAIAVTGCSRLAKKDKSTSDYERHAARQSKNDIAYIGGVDEQTRFYGSDGYNDSASVENSYSSNNTRRTNASIEELLDKKTFRFGYDRFDVSAADYDYVNAHASYLKQNPNKRLRVEGHTDERGSREYNVGLGERRAKAISNIFLSKGVSPRQFSVVSYGEEKPELVGHNEDAYRLNRRAVIVYEE